MRKLVIMRGPQGSGKSTILERTGLSWHAISPDAIRATVAGLRLHPYELWTVDNENNGYVWRLARESLTRRIAGGETIAFDATFPSAAELEEIAFEARDAGYDVLVVDMWSCDPDAAFARNMARHPNLRTPRQTFDRFFRLATTTRALDPSLRVIAPGEDIDAAVEAVDAFLMEGMEPIDLSDRYDRIVHVGDLQGCLTPVLDPASGIMEAVADPRALVVFVGDLLDRGIENGRVVRWWLDEMIDRPNVVLIAGNHEDHIEIEAAGQPPVSRDFARRTLPQLQEAGIGREDLARLASSFRTHLAYLWHGRAVLVTHSGMGFWPQPMWGVPTAQLRKGAGRYHSPIDEAWARWSAGDDALDLAMRLGVRELWQVHGHRNQRMLPVIAADRSINLEGQIEFGGHLRTATLSSDGWSVGCTRNTIHRTMQEFHMQDVTEGRQSYAGGAPIAPWAKDGVSAAVPYDADRFAAVRSDPMIFESPSETMPNVSAFNFSKQAFWGKHWNAVTTRTRGLFVNVSTMAIVARSYDKFFNHGERRRTSDEALEANLVFPVVGYVKENGFLGITGYDDETGSLVVASKSRMEGQFAGWFRDILSETLGEAGMERLLRFNRDQGASCTFEVVDPVNDPHIIEEPKARVILLDAVRRSEDFEEMPYQDLLKLGEHLGCEVKRLAFRSIPDWPTLKRIIDRIENDETWRPNRGGGQVEGVVIEDSGEGAARFRFKVKARHYALWKRARNGKERIALVRRNEAKTLDMSRYDDDQELGVFMRWAMRQNDETLSWDIVRLRAAYLADPEALIDGGAPETVVVEDHAGFLKGVDAIAAQLAAGRAKPETLSRLVARAGESDSRRAAFDAHPSAAAIRAAAEQHDRAVFMASRGTFADMDEDIVSRIRDGSYQPETAH